MSGLHAQQTVPNEAPRLLVSTTADVVLGGGLVVSDGGTARVRVGEPPRPHLDVGHLLAATGLSPSDVDAVALRPGVAPGHAGSYAFSLLSNEGGFLDGDLLGLAPGGGFTVLVAEQEIAEALGVPGASLDVDAFEWAPSGELWFSLQSDLAGTHLGDVADGDLLRVEKTGAVTRAYTESEVEALVQTVTGSTQPIGDVLGLALVDGEPWVTVQSPSAFDGAVLDIGATPEIVADESALLLAGAELDGLAVLPEGGDAGTLALAPQIALPGDPMEVHVLGGTPARPMVVVAGGIAGSFATPWLGGWGALALDPTDPWLALAASGAGFPILTLDATGGAFATFALPPSSFGGTGLGGEPGWTFQLYDPIDAELWPPFRVAL